MVLYAAASQEALISCCLCVFIFRIRCQESEPIVDYIRTPLIGDEVACCVFGHAGVQAGPLGRGGGERDAAAKKKRN